MEFWIINGRSFIDDSPLSLKIKNEFIEDVLNSPPSISPNDHIIIDAKGSYIIPGAIDAHVHFREPGLTHIADFKSEGISALKGGVTTVLEMPNTIPFVCNTYTFSEKLALLLKKPVINFGLYFGAHPYHLHQLLKISSDYLAGIKLYLPESTAIKSPFPLYLLETLFEFCKKSKNKIIVHSENPKLFTNLPKNSNNLPPHIHSLIRNRKACISATKKIISIIRKTNVPTHIAHVSTEEEIELIYKAKKEGLPLTAEVAIPHLFFSTEDYEKLGNFIKVNPAIKDKKDKESLWNALSSEVLDIIVSDHAPHLLENKKMTYELAPSGIPSIEFFIPLIFSEGLKRNIPPKTLMKLITSNPSSLFNIKNRGKIQKKYYADIILLKKHKWKVLDFPILSKCQWTPFQDLELSFLPSLVFINGKKVFSNEEKTKDISIFAGKYVYFSN